MQIVGLILLFLVRSGSLVGSNTTLTNSCKHLPKYGAVEGSRRIYSELLEWREEISVEHVIVGCRELNADPFEQHVQVSE